MVLPDKMPSEKGVDMARASKAGGKISKAKVRKAGLADPSKTAKAERINHISAPAATQRRRLSASDLQSQLELRTHQAENFRRQQAATAEIFKVINSSKGDLTPVFDIILEKAHSLCDVTSGSLQLIDGDQIRSVAVRGMSNSFEEFLRNGFHLSDRLRQSIQHRNPAQTVDMAEALGRISDEPALRAAVELGGIRTMLSVALASNGVVHGRIVAARKEVRPFTGEQIALIESFADQAGIAIENARLLTEQREVLEQQAASAEILRTIASAPGDAGKSLERIAETTARLFGAHSVTIRIAEGDEWIRTIRVGPGSERVGSLPDSQLGAKAQNLPGTVYRENRQIHVPDLDIVDPTMADWPMMTARAEGTRTISGTPLRREGKAIGALVVFRDRLAPFTVKELALQQSFADQAVIAIENARLFNEIREALAYQTGSSNVLRVIASSPTDVEPVLKAIVESARELCEANDAVVLLKDAEHLHFSAHSGPIPVTLDKWPISRDWTAGRAFVDQKPVHVHDMLSGEGAEFPDARAMGQSTGSIIHTVLSVPLLRGTESIGAILLRRTEVRPFNEKQINVLSTFADQAVIAIQNARLFNETKEALEQQTATADILKVIASSPDDIQPVFQAIAERSNRLVNGLSTTVLSVVNDSVFLSAFTRTNPAADAALIASFPRKLSTQSFGDSILKGEIFRLPDTEADPGLRDLARLRGYRSMLFVPLLHDGAVIGMIGQTRVEPGTFPENHVQLLKTFADQAVIAITNVGLFKEVKERTRELSASLDDLRTAQDRLVQTEKLASLGQLTAGIAHEIKNPLNFVNNFSSLSVELTGELNDVLKPVVMNDKVREEVDELTGLLKSNLEKVVQHGKRADSIVKNMLLHSREGSGELRAVDINGLVEESLNLAYHGARAETPSFNVTLEHDLDPDAGTVELYPQEITRALLNLISNGFYAAAKRKSEAANENFEPTLTTTTKNLGTTVEIRIRDNGTGITPEVKQKMFNPFFTTKPAGDGTGLGLSMSHDIVVKQHGGRIDVESVPGAFTEFTVVLPRTSSMESKQGGQA
jgi:two-component system NtrC family sensor kinase